MEAMFYIIAGKFNPSNDDFPVKTLITKDKFADKYAQDCTNLLDQQDIFKIIDKIMSAITNGIDIYLYKALDGTMSRALKDAGLGDKITWFYFDF